MKVNQYLSALNKSVEEYVRLYEFGDEDEDS